MGDYDDTMNFDMFQRWINDYYFPTWKTSFFITAFITLEILTILFHVKCTTALRKLLGHKWKFSVNRKWRVDPIQAPTLAKSFAKAPVDLLRMR